MDSARHRGNIHGNQPMSTREIQTENGVSVLKEIVTDGVPMPAVRFAFRSEHEGPVAIRVVETLPEGVELDDIGFHREYGREYWRTDGDRTLAFERVIEPDERLLTVYFVRGDSVDLDSLAGPPTIDHVLPVDEDDAEEVPVFRGSASTETPIDDGMTIERAIDETAAGEPLELRDEADGTRAAGDGGRVEEGDRAEEEPIEGDSANPDVPLKLNEPDEQNAPEESETSTDESSGDDEETPADEPLKLNDPSDASPTDGETMKAETGSVAASVEAGATGSAADEQEAGDGGSRATSGSQPQLELEHPEPTSSDGGSPSGPDGDNDVAETEIDPAIVESIVEERLDERLSTLDEDLRDGLVGSIDDRIEAALDEAVEAKITAALEEASPVEALEETTLKRVEAAIEERIEAHLPDDGEGSDNPIGPAGAEEMAAAIEEADEETRERLSSALGGGSVPHHLEARIQRVEREFNELAAYTDALREFLDEEGSGREILDDVNERLRTVEDTAEELHDGHDEFEEELDDVMSTVGSLADLPEEVATVTERVERNASAIEDGEEALAQVDDRLTQLTDRLSDLSDSTEKLWYHRNQLVESLESVAASLAEPIDVDQGELGEDGDGLGDDEASPDEDR